MPDPGAKPRDLMPEYLTSTLFFPLNVPEAIMIEPTESESRETLDEFVENMIALAELAKKDPDVLHKAPVTTPVGRLDEVAAAKNMDLVYTKPE